MPDVHEQAVLDAIVNVASLETLEVLCRGTNSAYSARALASRSRRSIGEVLEALEAFASAGVVRREEPDGAEALYTLAPTVGLWRFARSFAESYGLDSGYSRFFIDALVRNTGRRAARPVAA
jgi:hypothetical protein